MADAAACVYCGRRAVDPRHRPFCSERCRMADLGRWLGGHYRVAGPAADNGPTSAIAESDEDRGGSSEPEA